jgi:hypothetical protein
VQRRATLGVGRSRVDALVEKVGQKRDDAGDRVTLSDEGGP